MYNWNLLLYDYTFKDCEYRLDKVLIIYFLIAGIKTWNFFSKEFIGIDT